MNKSTLDLVREFHVAFNRPIHTTPCIKNENSNGLRLRLLREEVDELEEALRKRDYAGTLDALTDIQYILDGTYLSLGFAHLKDRAFELVHEKNMAKLGPDGKPMIREDGKILKPTGWTPPDLTTLL